MPSYLKLTCIGILALVFGSMLGIAEPPSAEDKTEWKTHRDAAKTASTQGNLDEVRTHLEAAILAADTEFGSRSLITADRHEELANFHFGMSAPAEALLSWAAVYDIRRTELGESHDETLSALLGVASSHMANLDMDAAEAAFLRIIEIESIRPSEDRVASFAVFPILGMMYEALGRYDEAEQMMLGFSDELENLSIGMDAVSRDFGIFGNEDIPPNHQLPIIAFGHKYLFNFGSLKQIRSLTEGGSRQSAEATFSKSSIWHAKVTQYWLARSGRTAEADMAGRLVKQITPGSGKSEFEDVLMPWTMFENDWFEHIKAADQDYVAIKSWIRNQSSLINETDHKNDVLNLSSTISADLSSALQPLGADTAMVQISPFDDRTFIFVTLNDGTQRQFERPVRAAEIAQLVELIQVAFLRTSNLRSGAINDDIINAETSNQSLELLYNHLMAPVVPWLEANDVSHIVLNLHGDLRAVPFAALNDGDHFLAEKFTLSRYVWGEMRLSKGGSLNSGAGFGTTKAHHGFSPLPHVRAELAAIFNLESNGVLGDAYLNAAFTKEKLVNAISMQPDILHIASHFKVSGYDSGASSLLMGDGSLLPLAEINTEAQLSFEGIDLVVLSACSTGVAAIGAGLEADGVARVIKARGADTVVASMWNVNDEGTAEFMRLFYDYLGEPDSTVSSALAATQRDFIAHDDTMLSDPYVWSAFVTMGGR